MTATAEATAPSLFERIGGTEGVRTVVERFYDLMQDDPRYAPLRKMHEEDLFPMRVSLTQFLSAWLGGPRDWFEARPGTCIMSMHRAMGITPETAAQWVEAMSRALADARVEKALGTQMQQAFLRMAGAMMKA
ncbi:MULTISPECIES: group II truncated hemoglobin [Sphingomonas]|jgi:hemoglobin|uniref:group II truncated hemoglobin n=1 Tax=Sphingomonas TaxID=13687 RepID=UPI001AE258B7